MTVQEVYLSHDGTSTPLTSSLTGRYQSRTGQSSCFQCAEGKAAYQGAWKLMQPRLSFVSPISHHGRCHILQLMRITHELSLRHKPSSLLLHTRYILTKGPTQPCSTLSHTGSVECLACVANYVYDGSGCVRCGVGLDCSNGPFHTLETLTVEKGYFRFSATSPQAYPCSLKTCLRSNETSNSGIQCSKGLWL